MSGRTAKAPLCRRAKERPYCVALAVRELDSDHHDLRAGYTPERSRDEEGGLA